ncbi:endolytic transglycosylase MltG [Candidatus Uhrbacteria bacterium]|nr:endolytic transglycosylase MltG [Candidatus Uhrbacteria bacterium]
MFTEGSVFATTVRGWDVAAFRAVNGLAGRNGFLDRFGIFLAEWLIVLAALAVLAMAVWPFLAGLRSDRLRLGDDRRCRPDSVVWAAYAAVMAGITGVFAWVGNQAFSFLVLWRDRPPISVSGARQLIEDPLTDKSFPSDHSSVAFAMAFSLALYRPVLGVFFVAAAVAVAWGRVFVGVHFPADVVAGAAVGAFWAVLVRFVGTRFGLRERFCRLFFLIRNCLKNMVRRKRIGRPGSSGWGRVLRRVLFVVLALSLGGWMVLAWLSSPGQPSDSSFVVRSGDSADLVSRRLKDGGFIRNRTIFLLAMRDSGMAEKLQPGVHDLAGVKSHREIIGRLVSGKVTAEETVLRVLEGWNLRDIMAELERHGHPAAESLFLVTGLPEFGYLPFSHIPPDFRSDYGFLSDWPDGASLEGYLFPDTYRVFRDATAEEIVRKLLNNFSVRLESNGLPAEIEASGRSLHEILTMASILEKEVRGEGDQRMVADIFWRRLEIGMALQSCATVNYATGKGEAAVSAEDLEIDSPFNTYRNRGLPPGPIGNPGLEAIRSAASPQPNDYWYFLTDGDGNVHYARNFDEHKANKARYLR